MSPLPPPSPPALTTPTSTTPRHRHQTYVASRDPYATLQIGKMTLTKLKDAFAIFKNLVLEARANAAAAASGAEGGEAKDGSAPAIKGASGEGDGGGDGGESDRRQMLMLQDKLKVRYDKIQHSSYEIRLCAGLL